MNHTGEDKPAHDHVQIALEESCAILVTLELVLGGVGDERLDAGVRALVVRAIASVREVIAELRMT